MRRKAVLIIAAAAALAAVVVVVTAGAFAGASGRSDQPGDGGFVSCLASHGVRVPSDDPAAVKQWLSDRQNYPVVQAALDACAPGDQQAGGTESEPTPAALVACLERHVSDVPSDVKENPDALKPWLAEAMKQPGVRAAVDACAGGPPPNGQK
jgi:hypothetical protein